jgi:hypothetical protein
MVGRSTHLAHKNGFAMQRRATLMDCLSFSSHPQRRSMSILIGKYEFDGPYETIAALEDKQGMYAILHREGEEYELIHISESENVKECIQLSQAAYSSLTGEVLIAACYTERCGPRERKNMVAEIQKEFDEESKVESETQVAVKVAY